MTAPKCTQESISCITCTGSRQVRSVYNAASVFHSCNQSLPRNAPGLKGQEITLTIPGGKKITLSFYLPRRFGNLSGIILVLPSQSLARPGEHLTSECFRPLPRFFLRSRRPAPRPGQQLHRPHAHDCPPPSRNSANRKPPLCRDQ